MTDCILLPPCAHMQFKMLMVMWSSVDGHHRVRENVLVYAMPSAMALWMGLVEHVCWTVCVCGSGGGPCSVWCVCGSGGGPCSVWCVCGSGGGPCSVWCVCGSGGGPCSVWCVSGAGEVHVQCGV